jgi:adenylate kinase family enzyme
VKRVLVIGSGGSGKSTFARRLGEMLRLEVIHLDKIYWHPGWVETPREEWLRKVDELCRGESWVMDGNYSGTLDRRLEACDTVVFLDLPRTLCLRRVLKRMLTYRKSVRPDMTEGCPERLSLKFLRWVWNYPTKSRPKVLGLLEGHSAGRRVFRLRTAAEVESFLEGLDVQKHHASQQEGRATV